MWKLLFLLSLLSFLSGEDIPDCCSTMCDPALIVSTEDLPYYGTAHALPDIIHDTDESEFMSLESSGKKTVDMLFAIGEKLQPSPSQIFQAKFKGGLTVTVAVHNQVKGGKRKYAKMFSEILGRVPSLFRTSIKHLHLIPGIRNTESCGASGMFKTGTVTLCVDNGLELIEKGTCEELFLHESAHVTLDPLILKDAAAYACAMTQDHQFISTYAMDNSYTEDVAESVVPWYAVRFAGDRLDDETRDIIENTIPHRLEYFDNFYAELI